MNQIDSQSRRSLLCNTVLAGGALAAGAVASSPTGVQAAESPKLKKDAVVLFQGDSITDAGRDRKRAGANNPRGLGDGYPFLVASHLLTRFSKKNLQCFNRGVSGNKVPDLDRRWQEDCVAIQPDVLSILIGVNDIWHKLNGKYDGSVKDYETGLSALLNKTREALPSTTIVICEPFVLRCGAVKESWFPEFDQRRAACKRSADEIGAIWVPFQSMFDQAVERNEPSYWAGDGVHPSVAGHALMAKTWMKTVFPPRKR